MGEKDKRKKVILELMKDPVYVPMKLKQLAVLLQVSEKDRQEFNDLMEELLEEGEIEVKSRGRYVIAGKKEYTGSFIANARGFGFVEIEGRDEDFYIPAECVHGALNKDRVLIRLLPGKKGKRQEAEVIKVIERGNSLVVGYFDKQKKGYGFVIPDDEKLNEDIFVDGAHENGAKDGMKVVVRLTGYKEGKSPEGEIVELLGMEDEPGVDMLSILRVYNIPTEFDENVLSQAKRVAKPVSEADRNFRLDLRQVQMVTIDGEDAKDLDDAVSLSLEGDNYILGVHIADVTNYVQENSALDREALKRGTSVYLPDRVCPMLPAELSNGCCSLNQGEDRLALSCIMTIDKKGKVLGSRIEKTVINVDKRMSYNQVNAILSGEAEELDEEYGFLFPMLRSMGELSRLLRENRFKKGSIDFDFPETKVILDEEGRVLQLKPYESSPATRLIEEFMLAANCAVAESFYFQELPFVYRIHEKPSGEKIKELAGIVSGFGHVIRGNKDEIHPMEIQKLLEEVSGKPEEALVCRITLRAMQKAKYSSECEGHFGLSFERYCHFTSPIRRYPDLQIHRIIKEQLSGKLDEGRIEHYNNILPRVAKQSSDREIAAAECEREAVKLKKVQYMSQFAGEEFDGIISGVTSWGIYVELPNTVEGLVPIASVKGDYFRYSAQDYSFIGETTGKVYSLGMPVRVKCTGTNEYSRTIDFELVSGE